MPSPATVQRALSRLSDQLGQLLPGETIKAESNGKNIVLSGQVSSKDMIERAVNLAGGYVDEAACAVCPGHSWAFRLQNGQLRDSPGVAVSTYKTRLMQRPEGKPTLVQADLPIF